MEGCGGVQGHTRVAVVVVVVAEELFAEGSVVGDRPEPVGEPGST